MCTGPGRPVSMAFQARCKTKGTWSARMTSKVRLVTGATIWGKSGEAKRSSSCMTPWPRMCVAALPLMRSRAVESQCAVANPMMVFVAPGPIEVQAAIGWPVTR